MQQICILNRMEQILAYGASCQGLFFLTLTCILAHYVFRYTPGTQEDFYNYIEILEDDSANICWTVVDRKSDKKLGKLIYCSLAFLKKLIKILVIF